MIFFDLPNQQVRLEARLEGVSAGRRRKGMVDGEATYGAWRRGAAGVADHETLADYRAAVSALLQQAGLTQAEAEDAFWQRVTQLQWANKP